MDISDVVDTVNSEQENVDQYKKIMKNVNVEKMHKEITKYFLKKIIDNTGTICEKCVKRADYENTETNELFCFYHTLLIKNNE